MPKIPRISEVEWEIMRVVWERSPMSASEIIDALVASDASWHPKTAKTLLNRLVKKGALGFSKEGRLYLYRPLAAEKDCVDDASASFLDRVFGGSLEPMLAHFVEHRKLSRRQIEELKRLLSGKEK